MEITLPTDPEYNTVRLENNQAFSVFPWMIAYPATDDDVSFIISWCVQNHLPIFVRSGGHSYEAFSVGNGVVIDQSKRLVVSVDTTNNTVTSESGVSIGYLVGQLEPFGLVLPTGTCATVHLFGLALGGGIGFLTRKLGLTCDVMISATVVLADGTHFVASNTQNSDLYWALRGAGQANFGVVTSLTFQATPLTQIVEVLGEWQRFMPNAPDDLSSEFNIFPGNKDIEITGQYVGTHDRLKSLLKPLLNIGTVTDVRIWHSTISDAIRYFSGTQRRIPYYKNKSDFVTAPIPPSGIRVLQKYMQDIPFAVDGDRIEMDAFGGKVNEYSPTDTAFPHRHNILYWMHKQKSAG